MENIQWLSDPQISTGVGNKLKEWRLELNHTQQTVAEKSCISLQSYQRLEKTGKGTIANLIRVLRTLNRLESLEPFLREKEISPIEYQKLEQGIKTRKRASKTKHNVTNTHGTPLW